MTRIPPSQVSLEPSGDVLVQTPDDDVLFTPLQVRALAALSPDAVARAVELLDVERSGDCS